MKPILKLNDENLDITTIRFHEGDVMYVTVNNDEVQNMIWNGADIDDHIDLDSHIDWIGRYEPVFNAIRNIVESNNDKLSDLAKQIAAEYTQTGYVNPKLSSEYTELKNRMYGIAEVRRELRKRL